MKIPQAVKSALWSYDTKKMSLSNPDHRFILIINILNLGTDDAVDWLLGNIENKDVAEAIKKSYVSEWNKKSLVLWSHFFNSYPAKKNRLE